MFSEGICQGLDFFRLQQRLEKLEKINEDVLESLTYEAQNLKPLKGEKDGN